MRDQKGALRKKIVDSKDLDDAALAELASAVKDFKAQFATKQPPAGQASAKPAQPAQPTATPPAAKPAAKPVPAKAH